MRKILSMLPGTLVAVALVAVRDPAMLFRLGRVLKLSGRCAGTCSDTRLRACMSRRLKAMQGRQPSPLQSELLMIAAQPIRQALTKH